MSPERFISNIMNELIYLELTDVNYNNIFNITNKKYIPTEKEDILIVLYSLLIYAYMSALVLAIIISLSSPSGKLRKNYANCMAYLFEYVNVQFIEQNRLKLFPKPLSFNNGFAGRNSLTETNANSISEMTYKLDSNFYLLQSGLQTIVADGFTICFESKYPSKWNFLLRYSNAKIIFSNFELTIIWMMSFIVRYFVLLPVRIGVFLLSVLLFLICTLFIGSFKEGKFKRKANDKLTTFCFNLLSGCLGIVTTFHNIEDKPASGIVVANHTSPIDSLILATDRCYDMVGRKQNGFLGFFMKILSWCSAHLWFNPTMTKERSYVTDRLKEHINDPNLPPIVIYPEGVCVNNTSVVQFKKGVFELNGTICPVALKFDLKFGDPFWWQKYFFYHGLSIMTSWAIVCDVWYLPPTQKISNESTKEFCKRVKTGIAKQAGLTSIEWDGFLYYGIAITNERKEQEKQQFTQFLIDEGHHSRKPHSEDYRGR